MREVYSSAYIADCDQLRVRLSLAGIESTLKNEFGNPIGLVLLGGVATFAWPEVWVNETDYEAAMKIAEETIKAAKESSAAGNVTEAPPAWTCPKCGEVIDGTMNACWRCDTERPTDSV